MTFETDLLGFYALFLTFDRILGITQISVALRNILDDVLPVMFFRVKHVAPRTSLVFSESFILASRAVVLGSSC